jgi:hypothetical protein
MHRIDTPTAQTDKFGAGKNGFTNGDPSTGRKSTDLNSDMWDAVQEEICNAIEKSGATLNKSEHDQLYKAIVKLITDRVPDALLRKNNLSDLVDKAVSRANLGLKSAATADIQTSRDDITSGRVLTNGGAIATRSVVANGIAGSAITDANNLPGNSVSFVYGSATNSPGFESSVLDFAGFNTGYNVQLTASYNTKGLVKLRTRNGDNNTWSGWTTFYTTDNKPTAADTNAVPLLANGIVNAVQRIQNIISIFTTQSGSPLELGHLTGTPGNFYIDIHTDGTQDGVDYSHRLTFKPGGGFSIQTQGGGMVSLGDNGGDVVARGSISASGSVNSTGDIRSERNISTAGILQAGTGVYESNGAVRVYSSNNPPPQQDLSPYVTYGVADGRYLMDVARGGQALQNAGHTTENIWEAPEGCYMTGLNIRADLGDCRSMGKYYRAIVVRVYNGSWRQIGSIA